MRTRFTVGIVTCVALFAVAGCGGDDDETTATTEATTTATGATGAGAEGTADVQALLETSFVSSGLTEGEASCVAELVAPQISGEQVTELQDPAFVEELLKDQESEIEECEGQ